MSAALNSFELDELCRAALRQANAPVVDYPQSDMTDALMASHRQMVRATAAFCLSFGFLLGMATSVALMFFGASS